MLKEIKDFLLHLRLHYQFFILSGGYLLGGLIADEMNTTQFWVQFLNVHILLFGGATAYNSYWDKDEGPIGGLKHPPKMTAWMHKVSLLMMFAGWAWAITVNIGYFLVFGVSLLLFWLYSTPHARWKGRPLASMVAIALSTGTNSVLLGFWAAGGLFTPALIAVSAGAALILLSLYPTSQVYQIEEDSKRGDKTFTMRFGLNGVKLFFRFSYLSGLILLTLGFYAIYTVPAIALFITALLSFFILNAFVTRLKGVIREYPIVMKIKFAASLAFVLFLIASNAIRYEWIGDTFLRTYF
ncbi:MAG: UbiA prenyltransferase family protein [Balneolaceae bacterium]|nr:UbiA prenyltransferase family protein [Balneolaceae bacterium]